MIQLGPLSNVKKDPCDVAASQSGVKWPQFLAGSLAAGGALCSGAIMGWSLLQYDSYYTLSNRTSEETVFIEDHFLKVSMLTLGTLHGALPAGFLADILGKKTVLLLMAGLFWVSGMLLAFSSHMEWLLYMSHFLSGFATGCNSVVIPLYNEEIAEASVRGRLGVLYEIFFCTGVLLSCLKQMMFPNFHVPLLHFLLPLLFFVMFIWMPESPIFLTLRGKENKVQEAIQWLRTSKSHPLYDISAEMNSIRSFLEKTRFRKLSKYYMGETDSNMCCGYRKGTNISIVCIIMIVRPMCGVYAMISYRKVFFEMSGLSPNTISIIVIIFLLLSSIVSLGLVDRFGRRALLIHSLAGCTVSQVLFAQYFYLRDHGFEVATWGWVCNILFVVFIICFGIGLGPLPWLIMAETLPSESKKWSSGLAVSINWLMTFFITSAFYAFINCIGNTGTFGLLFFINVLGIVFATLFLLETKGRMREEIQ